MINHEEFRTKYAAEFSDILKKSDDLLSDSMEIIRVHLNMAILIVSFIKINLDIPDEALRDINFELLQSFKLGLEVYEKEVKIFKKENGGELK